MNQNCHRKDGTDAYILMAQPDDYYVIPDSLTANLIHAGSMVPLNCLAKRVMRGLGEKTETKQTIGLSCMQVVVHLLYMTGSWGN